MQPKLEGDRVGIANTLFAGVPADSIGQKKSMNYRSATERRMIAICVRFRKAVKPRKSKCDIANNTPT